MASLSRAEHSAAQCSAPRRTAPHRRRATSDPTREIARLAASLRIAASRIARLRSMLQQQRRQQADGQQQHNHGHQPAHPEAPSTPRQPPADIAQPKHPNARQRRSARRAAQWWQNQQKCSSLEKNLSSPQNQPYDRRSISHLCHNYAPRRLSRTRRQQQTAYRLCSAGKHPAASSSHAASATAIASVLRCGPSNSYLQQYHPHPPHSPTLPSTMPPPLASQSPPATASAVPSKPHQEWF